MMNAKSPRPPGKIVDERKGRAEEPSGVADGIAWGARRLRRKIKMTLFCYRRNRIKGSRPPDPFEFPFEFADHLHSYQLIT
jgi:hypothetical protein